MSVKNLLKILGVKSTSDKKKFGKHIINCHEFSDKVVLSIILKLPLSLSTDICLLLISAEEIMDDYIYIYNKELHFARCYPDGLNDTEYRMLFRQQIVVADTIYHHYKNTAN